MSTRLSYADYEMLKNEQMQLLHINLHEFNIYFFSSYGTPIGITNAQFREFMFGRDGLSPNLAESRDHEDEYPNGNAIYIQAPSDNPPISREAREKYLQDTAPNLKDIAALRNPHQIDTPPSKRPKTTGVITSEVIPSGGSRRRYGKKSRRRYGKKSRRR